MKPSWQTLSGASLTWAAWCWRPTRTPLAASHLGPVQGVTSRLHTTLGLRHCPPWQRFLQRPKWDNYCHTEDRFQPMNQKVYGGTNTTSRNQMHHGPEESAFVKEWMHCKLWLQRVGMHSTGNGTHTWYRYSWKGMQTKGRIFKFRIKKLKSQEASLCSPGLPFAVSPCLGWLSHFHLVPDAFVILFLHNSPKITS